LSPLNESKGTGHGCAPSVVIFTHINMRHAKLAQVHRSYRTSTYSGKAKACILEVPSSNLCRVAGNSERFYSVSYAGIVL